MNLFTEYIKLCYKKRKELKKHKKIKMKKNAIEKIKKKQTNEKN